MKKEELGYIGDDLNDLNDLKAMLLASFVACPLDACDEIKNIADYISKKMLVMVQLEIYWIK